MGKGLQRGSLPLLIIMEEKMGMWVEMLLNIRWESDLFSNLMCTKIGFNAIHFSMRRSCWWRSAIMGHMAGQWISGLCWWPKLSTGNCLLRWGEGSRRRWLILLFLTIWCLLLLCLFLNLPLTLIRVSHLPIKQRAFAVVVCEFVQLIYVVEDVIHWWWEWDLQGLGSTWRSVPLGSLSNNQIKCIAHPSPLEISLH